MPKKKLPLEQRLETMADDIQIGGETCYRSMGVAVVLGRMSHELTSKQVKYMERLLSRGERLLRALHNFWNCYPELDEMVDKAW